MVVRSVLAFRAGRLVVVVGDWVDWVAVMVDGMSMARVAVLFVYTAVARKGGGVVRLGGEGEGGGGGWINGGGEGGGWSGLGSR